MALLSISRMRYNDVLSPSPAPSVRMQPGIDAANHKRGALQPDMYGLLAFGEIFKLHNEAGQ